MIWNQFLNYWPVLRGTHRSLLDSPHKGQLMWITCDATVKVPSRRSMTLGATLYSRYRLYFRWSTSTNRSFLSPTWVRILITRLYTHDPDSWSLNWADVLRSQTPVLIIRLQHGHITKLQKNTKSSLFRTRYGLVSKCQRLIYIILPLSLFTMLY